MLRTKPDTAHTPGPWLAEADEDNDLGEYTVRTAEGDYIADVRNPYCDYDMQVAYAQSDDCRIERDARLIAAAPDLLASLKEAHGHLEHMAKFIGDQKLGYSFESLGEDIGNIRDAIARAEGRQP